MTKQYNLSLLCVLMTCTPIFSIEIGKKRPDTPRPAALDYNRDRENEKVIKGLKKGRDVLYQLVLTKARRYEMLWLTKDELKARQKKFPVTANTPQEEAYRQRDQKVIDDVNETITLFKLNIPKLTIEGLRERQTKWKKIKQDKIESLQK